MLFNCGYVVTATDNVRDYWPGACSNRHWTVIDDDITRTRLRSSFDFITCISTLEHIQDPDAAVGYTFALLNPGEYSLS